MRKGKEGGAQLRGGVTSSMLSEGREGFFGVRVVVVKGETFGWPVMLQSRSWIFLLRAITAYSSADTPQTSRAEASFGGKREREEAMFGT